MINISDNVLYSFAWFSEIENRKQTLKTENWNAGKSKCPRNWNLNYVSPKRFINNRVVAWRLIMWYYSCSLYWWAFIRFDFLKCTCNCHFVWKYKCGCGYHGIRWERGIKVYLQWTTIKSWHLRVVFRKPSHFLLCIKKRILRICIIVLSPKFSISLVLTINWENMTTCLAVVHFFKLELLLEILFLLKAYHRK